MTTRTAKAPAPGDPTPSAECLRLRGVRVHNLKNVDLDLPRGKLVVITGPSGSGKSSLAFDTIFAEGQRQYIESLSAYARQFLQQMERPDVDEIEGLEPTIAIDQRPGAHNPRSTVATVTEVYDHLRLLFARLGVAHCWRCGEAIRQQSPEQIVEELRRLPEGTRLIALAPMVRGRRGKHQEVFERIRKAGLVRARVDGQVYDLDHLPQVTPQKKHTIEAVVDRIVLRAAPQPRLAEAVELALKQSDGLVAVSYQEPGTSRGVWKDRTFNTRYACPSCGSGFEELSPRTFSFNSPYGACPTCEGLGIVEKSEEKSGGTATCPDCEGARLRPEARSVRVGGKSIAEVTAMTVAAAEQFFAELKFPASQAPVAGRIVPEIAGRLRFLRKVGLEYLSLDRPAQTLSGGESQRLRLATAIGSGLVGACYVLDEPSIGLHPRDNARLLAALRDLQALGNTLLVVEHDEFFIRSADWIVDLGPGAGERGGEVVTQGAPEKVAADPESITGRYLSGNERIEPAPRSERQLDVLPEGSITLVGARGNNLQNVTVSFPLGRFVCVTGVSGSGKSTLVNDTLARALYGSGPEPAPFKKLRGAEAIDRLIVVDQSPIGRTPRSNPATYTGAFDEIRKVFTHTREARLRGYKAGRFSFNVKGGRCERCQGHGLERIEMNFLPDLYVTCPQCRGRRFNRQTLEVLYRGKSIADTLDMPIEEAWQFFENFPALRRTLGCLRDVGLGYLRLGQPSTTLSGGEAQRVKLGAELSRPATGHTFYILDEPTTGLHFDDVRRLLDVLRRLVDAGHTVLVIEHHLDVLRQADHLIDLGPEGGSGGGRIVATGPPQTIAQCPESYTGAWLAGRMKDES